MLVDALILAVQSARAPRLLLAEIWVKNHPTPTGWPVRNTQRPTPNAQKVKSVGLQQDDNHAVRVGAASRKA